ncbi:hypothetical protein G4B88_030158 [Cannabis sativa]|uniref:Terpene synthase N-terminal domain-containing protein n=1 Tax=Cannabis sativa TaxID=3483 RepID=A0A7J6E059_CANSA|nr:hypothetical protein G4B88_030158 [Cannabis sativa]
MIDLYIEAHKKYFNNKKVCLSCRIPDSLPCLYNKVLAASVDATLNFSPTQKQAVTPGILGGIMKGLKAEKVEHNADLSGLHKNIHAHLETLFSSPPFLKPSTALTDDQEIIQLNLDDIVIDEPLHVSSSSQKNKNETKVKLAITLIIMSTQILASSYSNENPYKIVRSTKTFHPHIWGEQFLHYNISEQDWYCQQQKVEKLKEVIRREIFGESSSSSAYYDSWKNQLKLIDVVERLGLSYHFESEIENMIEQIYNKTNSDDFLKDEDLHDVSLWFTLLRQHGFRVSSASHLSCVGENILDEALAFTTTHLIEFLAKTKDHYDDDDFLSKEISQALERPLRKTLVNLHAKHFISIYEKDASHNKVLLQLAKLDFNLLQSMHKEELSEISRTEQDPAMRNKSNRIAETSAMHQQNKDFFSNPKEHDDVFWNKKQWRIRVIVNRVQNDSKRRLAGGATERNKGSG